MPRVIILDKICPHCGGTEWLLRKDGYYECWNRRKKYSNKWSHAHLNDRKKYSKKFRDTHHECRLVYQRELVKQLKDSYIKRLIKASTGEVPSQEEIDRYRESLRKTREIKNDIKKQNIMEELCVKNTKQNVSIVDNERWLVNRTPKGELLSIPKGSKALIYRQTARCEYGFYYPSTYEVINYYEKRIIKVTDKINKTDENGYNFYKGNERKVLKLDLSRCINQLQKYKNLIPKEDIKQTIMETMEDYNNLVAVGTTENEDDVLTNNLNSLQEQYDKLTDFMKSPSFKECDYKGKVYTDRSRLKAEINIFRKCLGIPPLTSEFIKSKNINTVKTSIVKEIVTSKEVISKSIIDEYKELEARRKEILNDVNEFNEYLESLKLVLT